MGEQIEQAQLAELAQRLKRHGKKIVSTNGCFDILHVGHLRCLKQARGLGDVLVVGMNSDESVHRLKGPARPINTESDRAELLASLACVDYVSIFREDTACEFLKVLQPDIYVKGADYKVEDLPEAQIVKSAGRQIVTLPMVPDKSTTSTILKIRHSEMQSS